MTSTTGLVSDEGFFSNCLGSFWDSVLIVQNSNRLSSCWKRVLRVCDDEHAACMRPKTLQSASMLLSIIRSIIRIQNSCMCLRPELLAALQLLLCCITHVTVVLVQQSVPRFHTHQPPACTAAHSRPSIRVCTLQQQRHGTELLHCRTAVPLYYATPAAAYYTETLKYNKQFKVRVAGDSKSTDTALCVGYKPDKR